jgi:hypothetical protein
MIMSVCLRKLSIHAWLILIITMFVFINVMRPIYISVSKVTLGRNDK